MTRRCPARVAADLAAVKALFQKLGVDEVVEIAKLFG
jgi:hypothetical protein